MASYTNIKDILKQFELQVVQKKHYKKDEVYTKTQANTAISNAVNTAIAGINQFNIVVSSNASTTPKSVVWSNDGTNVTGTLEATSADAHTIYYVKSANGTNDSYDEYMAVSGKWEKIGNTDVDLTNYSLKSETVATINFNTTNGLRFNLANGDSTTFEQLGTASNWRTFLGATDTVSNSSAGLATPKMVYNLQEKTINSSSNGITLGGKVGTPTISVDTSSKVVAGGSSVVVGAEIYSFVTGYAQPKDADLTAIAALTGTSGFLKKTATDTWTLDDSTYLTEDTATRTYATNATAIGDVEFNSSKGLRYKTLDKLSSIADSDYNVIASIATLKSGLGINNVTNVATESTITQNSAKNITSGAVYTALNKAVSSTSYNVKLGGTVGNPTITVTEGSISGGSGGLIAGGTVYDYISSSSGVLYMSDEDFTAILNAV